VDVKLIRKVQQLIEKNIREPIKTWARASTVVPEFVGHTFLVHNGRVHLRVLVTEDMVGHKLGEFAPTRMFRGHGGRKVAAPGAPGVGAAAPAAAAPPKKE
jgi:small subunit ribosomal protein S19